MPWTEKDVKRHKKGLSTSQKKKWARIANAVLDKSNDEVLAIKVANSRTKRMNENVDIIIDNYLEEGVIVDYFNNLKNMNKDRLLNTLKKKKQFVDDFLLKIKSELSKNDVDIDRHENRVLNIINSKKPILISHVKNKNYSALKDEIKNVFVIIKKELFMFARDPEQRKSNLNKSLLLLLSLVVATICINLLIPLIVGETTLGLLIAGAVFAPLFEEISKKIAITGGFGPEFLAYFNAYEFSQYYVNLTRKGVPAIAVIISRLIGVGGHYLLGGIHTIGKHYDIENITVPLTIILHSVWNSLAILNQQNLIYA